MQDLISVIVTTYERSDSLDSVLRSLSRQTDQNYEVVVADDGSGSETEAVIAAWQPRFPVSLRHVWQPDKGFRAARSRNLAVLASCGDYLIFLDGDCVARPNFVAAHRRLREAKTVVGGNRVMLSESLTREVLANGDIIEGWSLRRWAREFSRQRVNRLSALFTVPGQFWRRWQPHAIKKAVSCNAALWRADFFYVDGFDARFEGWGYEDIDLVLRLKNAGMRYKYGRLATGVFHLWHPHSDASKANSDLVAATSASLSIRAINGLSSLTPPNAKKAFGRLVG